MPSGYALVPATVVIQTLVELSGMVILTRVVPRWLSTIIVAINAQFLHRIDLSIPIQGNQETASG